MLFFYVRHGDPIYSPDSLTPFGHRQAEAVAKRLALYGIDKIYSSPSTRAQLTAKPTCEILKKTAELVDFAGKLEEACIDTLNDGIMTKDLVGLVDEGVKATAVNSAGFIKAIRERLEAKLA